MGEAELQSRQDLADLDILTTGITFTVYTDGRGIDRAWPLDVVPRVIDADEWHGIEAGLVQRLLALNAFIDDVYNERRIVRDGVFPCELLDGSVNYRPECRGIHPAFGVWAHVSGSDLVRDTDGTMYVLEDNLRVPSGVSYLLENSCAPGGPATSPLPMRPAPAWPTTSWCTRGSRTSFATTAGQSR
jgi:uncharacterized circularly permuted ATP-grasp superfamily protein